MALKSLRSLKLPLTTAGKPEVVCQEILAPLFEAAAETILVCSDPSPEHLARMTWGMAPFVREGSKLTLIALVSDPSSTEMTADALRKSWAEALGSEQTAHRLSLYKYFAHDGRFTLHVRSIATCGAKNPLATRLAEGTGIAVMTDSADTKVELLWRETLQINDTTEVRADFRWSFGDPLRAVLNLHEAIGAVATKPREPLSELEATLRELIDALPSPKLPWDENFDEADPSGIVLYEHQKRAISEWFKNDCRGIFKMCTGAGKTISSLMAARQLAEEQAADGRPRPPVIVTVPTRVLADQWISEIKRLGFPSVLKAYESVDRWHHIIEPWLKSTSGDVPRFVVSTYCTFADTRFLAKLQSVAASGVRALWIADEVHNLSSPRLLAGMQQCAALFNFRLGLSATPDIEGNPSATERLRDFFGKQCASYELADGIKDKVLCPYRYHPVPAYLAPDMGQRYLALLQGIDQAKPGSPALLDLYRQSRDLLRTSGVQVAKFRDLLAQLCADGKTAAHTLVYCPPGYGSYGDESSDEIDRDADERRLIEDVITTLREHGVSCSSILGDTPSEQRREILRRFGAGDLQALCAIGCLDEGIDVPSIQRAVVLYSVDREKQFVQRRGRILRQPRGTKGKVAEIYDLIILPHGSSMPAAQAEALLEKEMRRYRTFAVLAENRAEAEREIARALSLATQTAFTNEPAHADQI